MPTGGAAAGTGHVVPDVQGAAPAAALRSSAHGGGVRVHLRDAHQQELTSNR